MIDVIDVDRIEYEHFLPAEKLPRVAWVRLERYIYTLGVPEYLSEYV